MRNGTDPRQRTICSRRCHENIRGTRRDIYFSSGIVINPKLLEALVSSVAECPLVGLVQRSLELNPFDGHAREATRDSSCCVYIHLPKNLPGVGEYGLSITAQEAVCGASQNREQLGARSSFASAITPPSRASDPRGALRIFFPCFLQAQRGVRRAEPNKRQIKGL